MNEELMITKEDLVNWLNRPPSNDDLDLIGFITTRLENFYKLEKENSQLKEDLKDACYVIEKLKKDKKKAREYIKNHQLVFEISNKKQIAYWFDMFYKELLEILGDNDLLDTIESGTKKPVADMKGLYEAIKEGRLEVDITEELYNYLKTYVPTEKSNNPVASFYGVKLNVKKEYKND